MTQIRFVHLSDVHLRTKTIDEQSVVLAALQADLATLAQSKPIDFFIFSGDLIFSADEPSDFALARQQLIDPLLSISSIPSDRFFIAPGNHDICRRDVRSFDYIDNGIRLKLTSTDALNSFIRDGWAESSKVDQVLLRMKPFSNFLSQLPQSLLVRDHIWAQTYKLPVSSGNVGIACFNTAWRATGESDNRDKGQLLIGEAVVQRASQDLEDCVLKIAVLHHPFHWLAEFDRRSCEPLINSRFNIVCTGHLHEVAPEVRKTLVGDALLLPAGALYDSREYPNTYHIVDIDCSALEFDVQIREYANSPTPAFHAAVKYSKAGHYKGSLDAAVLSDKARSVHRFLNHAGPLIKGRADRHITLVGAAEDQPQDFRETFVWPPIARYPEGQVKTRNSAAGSGGKPTAVAAASDQDDFLTPTAILTRADDLVLIGGRESGKSSIAHACALDCSRGISDIPRVPVLFDCAKAALSVRRFEQTVRSQFAALVGAENLLPRPLEVPMLAIFDNFSIDSITDRDELQKIKAKYPDLRAVLVVRQRSYELADIARTKHLDHLQTLYIHSLPRGQVRLLASRLSKQFPAMQLASDISDRVLNHIAIGGLPRTGYIVQLMLHAIKGNVDPQSLNESVLLQNIVDVLLNRRQQTTRADFDPKLQELLLADLAHTLPIDGSMSYNDTLSFTLNLLQQKGLNFKASQILDHLIGCGILEQIDDMVAFRFSVFHHYFHALWLQSHPAELAAVHADPRLIDWSRELELLTGLTRQADELIVSVLRLIETQASPELATAPVLDFTTAPFDRELGALSNSRLRHFAASKLTQPEVDELMDKADQRRPEIQKPQKDESNNTADSPTTTSALHVTAATTLLGALVRNSEFSDKEFKKTHVLAFIKWTLRLGHVILHHMHQVSPTIDLGGDENRREEIVRVIRSLFQLLIPQGLAELMKGAIASPKLAEILNEIAEDRTLPLTTRTYAALCLLDMEDHRAFNLVRNIAIESKDQIYTLTVLFERIGIIHSLRGYRENFGPRLIELMSDILIASGVDPQRRAAIVDNAKAQDALARANSTNPLDAN